MNDPEAIRFVNEKIRPLAEKLEALSAELGVFRTQWFGGLNTHFANAGEPVEDGREAEGTSRLTCGDVTNFVTQAFKTAPGEPGEWNAEIINKPTVRRFEAK